ncbi:PIN2/TERF1-interacting telomerase inhibitor 1-like [Hydractinia symbiolongicarpus]|uniref:PIN2/TERF1-interacting telomerase inhibitor 1-like n=1 Tax=Hydractinia symbiolongicarpus TaxID=13093 RepID=UPI00254FCE10|nr:PIN2/TERF1-interacting telomerase inhibitor 1-like [Hydractinia symbiolongicarpus]
MSMLAEPRSRQKWSDDPRNTRWANDKSKFGYQMLTKMGWSDGKGLGQKQNGAVSHIRVRKNRSNAGIGSKHSHDDDWISHQNDFNDLLSQLNKGSGGSSNKIQSLEDKVKSSKKKILYTKFVKSKDLSNASSHDLACIFGQRSKSAPATPQLSDEEGNVSDTSAALCPVTDAAQTTQEHGITTVHSGVSVADYFAKKMEALERARNNKSSEVLLPVGEDKNNVINDDAANIISKKKSVEDVKEDVESEEKLPNAESDSEFIMMKIKKKKKRDVDKELGRSDENNVNENIESKESLKKKKKRKKKNEREVDEEIEESDGSNQKEINDELKSEESFKKKKKKKKRRLDEETENNIEPKRKKEGEETCEINCEVANGDENEVVEKKSKKRRNVDEVGVVLITEHENEIKKVKKRRNGLRNAEECVVIEEEEDSTEKRKLKNKIKVVEVDSDCIVVNEDDKRSDDKKNKRIKSKTVLETDVVKNNNSVSIEIFDSEDEKKMKKSKKKTELVECVVINDDEEENITKKKKKKRKKVNE